MNCLLPVGVCIDAYVTIEEFPIIGFYLYHVTSAGQSSNWTTSGIKQHILTVDHTLKNFYFSVKILF